ncbi:MAG: hypothetical protein NWF08_08025 [Candidatus Bathyarchaeota archaeon]|nr:hypothetical protein [Candidatus Bathyarchaeota archaeon]
MSKGFKIFALVIILSCLFSNHYQIEVMGSNESILNVSRETKVGDYGLVEVNDIFYFDNSEGNEPINHLSFGFPQSLSKNIRYIEIIDPQERKLEFESRSDNTLNIEWIDVAFSEPIQVGDKSSYNMTMLFSEIIEFKEIAFIFNFPIHPITSTKAASSNAIIILPRGSTPILSPNSTLVEAFVGDREVLNQTISPLRPNEIEIASFNYTSDIQKLIKCMSIEKKILFESNGEVIITEDYSFFNYGNDASPIEITVPEDIEEVALYDGVGFVGDVGVEYPESIVSIDPRYTHFRNGENFNFQIKYNIPQNDYIEQLDWWGRCKFSILMIPVEDYIVDEYNIVLDFPEGTSFENIDPDGYAFVNSSRSSKTVIAYNYDNVIPLDHFSEIEIIYKYVPFWASIKPLFILLMIMGLVVISLVALTLKKPAKPALKIPMEKIRKYVDLQDEKNESRHQLEKQDEELIRGRISRREHQRRKKTIGIRISELNRNMMPLKNELRKADNRYAEVIRNIEKSESEIEALRMNRFQLRGQYRSGRIIKDAYESLISDIDRRINKAEETLEGLLITLREEAR